MTEPTRPAQHGQSLETPETIACLGSSTTAAKGTFKWIDELAKRPQNSRFRFVNFGVGGDLSVNIAKRLDPVLRVAPDRVIVLIGTNDILATVFPNFRRFTRAWKRISEEPSPAHFKDNLELITHRLQQETSATIALSSLAPVGEALRSNHAVQSRLNELVAAYNGIIGDVSRRSGAYYIPFLRTLPGPTRPLSGRQTVYPVLLRRVLPRLPVPRNDSATQFRRDLAEKWLGVPHRRHSPQHPGWPHPDGSRSAVP